MRNSFRRPARGPSNVTQAIAVMKLGVAKVSTTMDRMRLRNGIVVRETAQAIGRAIANAVTPAKKAS